jgi:hypothetical protein
MTTTTVWLAEPTRGYDSETRHAGSLRRCAVPIGSEQRRRERKPRVEALFPENQVEAVLDLLHLTDMAWHDCYGPRELEVPVDVLDDVILLSDGDLSMLVRLARSAVIDFRDVRVAADARRQDAS